MQEKFKSILKKHAEILLQRHCALNVLIKTVGNLDIILPKWKNIDDAVVYSVIGQMLSASASESIIFRLINHFGNSNTVIEWCVSTSLIEGPLLGVSQRKRKALSEWSAYKKNGNCIRWKMMPLEKLREEIIGIWGFGRWSSDMIAIFHLSRLDVWPETDKGIERACKIVFGNDKNIKEYVKGCETIASLLLWDLINKNLILEFQNNFKQWTI